MGRMEVAELFDCVVSCGICDVVISYDMDGTATATDPSVCSARQKIFFINDGWPCRVLCCICNKAEGRFTDFVSDACKRCTAAKDAR